MPATPNQQIAMKLAQAADLLEQQGASPFRVTAYRRASETVSRLSRD
ncbi:MAG: helix-hairpin-helix domain-containing protein, partial [Gammaproteobacteria bacterium]